MVFSSHIFAFYFLPLALLFYYATPGRGRHLVLTVLSYAFYGWANPAFTLLMLASTGVDYFCGRALGRGQASRRARRGLVAVSVVSNLSLLGFFKYFNFAVENYNSLLALLGIDFLAIDTVLRVTLPVGISFYTFQSMSYTLDVYRGRSEPLASFVDFACYVSMFPQLVAGPILRYSDVAEQLRERRHTWIKVARGVSLFALGMAKKILLANPCGEVADVTFAAGSVDVLDAWYGLVAYSFQIYFDFSGYSDMAVGLGLMLGFVFPKNFDAPYRARSLTDFWRRWHISLSTWLRDYLYISLGGNRKGARRTYLNLSLVMLLGGLWHGAAWSFLAWGAFHGLLLALERSLGKRSPYEFLPPWAQTALTYVLVLLSWVFFRAETLPRALDYLGNLFGLGPRDAGSVVVSGLLYTPYSVAALTAAATVVWGLPQAWSVTQKLSWPRVVVVLVLLGLSLLAMETQGYNPFLYFRF